MDYIISLLGYIEPILVYLTAVLNSIVFFSFKFKGVDIPLLILLLLVTGLMYSVLIGRYFLKILKLGIEMILQPKQFKETDNGKNNISPLNALFASLSGSVGLGNIAGVAIAISYGGPGALFWMIVCGFVAAPIRFAEAFLAHKYRYINEQGEIKGGPFYYLREGVMDYCNMPRLGVALSFMFCVATIISALGTPVFQSHQTIALIKSIGLIPDNYFATIVMSLINTLLIIIVVIGGISYLVRITNVLLPFVASLYICSAIIIILYNYNNLPGVMNEVIYQAFNFSSAASGMLYSMVIGFKRGFFSNEAGSGATSIIYSTTNVDSSVKIASVAFFEPILDTVVICAITGLTVLCVQDNGLIDPAINGLGGGIEIVTRAYATVASWFVYLLIPVIIIFAFTTSINWGYYGKSAWVYVLGDKIGRATLGIYYSLFFLISLIGGVIGLDAVVDLTDASTFILIFPNIIGLYILAKVVRVDTYKYFATKHK